MILAGMLDSKKAMAGFTVIIAGLAACRSAQGSSTPVTTCAGTMMFGVGAVNRYAGGSTVGTGMAGRAGKRHGDPVCVIDRTVCPNSKTSMA